jgi:hypothetical protein
VPALLSEVERDTRSALAAGRLIPTFFIFFIFFVGSTLTKRDDEIRHLLVEYRDKLLV